jgi:hypothetical protein
MTNGVTNSPPDTAKKLLINAPTATPTIPLIVKGFLKNDVSHWLSAVVLVVLGFRFYICLDALIFIFFRS